MPNVYIPRALDEMVKEEHSRLLREASSDGEAPPQYPAEWEALVALMSPDNTDEFRDRRGI